MYDDAIVSAALSGFLQHQDLANERAGLFYISQLQDHKLARLYLGRARVLYVEYGADAKVKHVDEICADQVEQLADIKDSTYANDCTVDSADFTESPPYLSFLPPLEAPSTQQSITIDGKVETGHFPV